MRHSGMGQATAAAIPDPWTQATLAREARDRGMGNITSAQVQPWIDLAARSAATVADTVRTVERGGQSPAAAPAEPAPLPPAPVERGSMMTPVLVGGGLLVATALLYMTLQRKTVRSNGRRSRRRRRR